MFKTLLAIDYGKSKIGISSGQMITKTSSPVGIIPAYNGQPNWYELDKVIKIWNPSDIIIGLPIDSRGINTYITKYAKIFAQEVKTRYKINIHFINEAFSTREARWRLKSLKNNKINNIKVDALAACVILETWMDEN